MGSLYIKGSHWKVIGPTEDGPQKFGTGGEVAIWESKDAGVSWKLAKQVTNQSAMNHGYVRRPVNARNPFFSFWADGNPDSFSKSFLYFSDSKGKRVYQLPYEMEENFERPI
jgi:hypothetical protein